VEAALCKEKHPVVRTGGLILAIDLINYYFY
jgi:hypothetical protein